MGCKESVPLRDAPHEPSDADPRQPDAGARGDVEYSSFAVDSPTRRAASGTAFESTSGSEVHVTAGTSAAATMPPRELPGVTDAVQAAEEYQQRIENKRQAALKAKQQRSLDEFDPIRPLDSFNITHRGLLGRCWDRRHSELVPITLAYLAALGSDDTTEDVAECWGGVHRSSHWFTAAGMDFRAVTAAAVRAQRRSGPEEDATPSSHPPRQDRVNGHRDASAADGVDGHTTAEREAVYNDVILKELNFSGVKANFAFQVGRGFSDAPDAKPLQRRHLRPAAGVQIRYWDHVCLIHPNLRTLARVTALSEHKSECLACSVPVASPDPVPRQTKSFCCSHAIAVRESNGRAALARNCGPLVRDRHTSNNTLWERLLRLQSVGLSTDLATAGDEDARNRVLGVTTSRNSGAEVRGASSRDVRAAFPMECVLCYVMSMPVRRLLQLEGMPATLLQLRLGTASDEHDGTMGRLVRRLPWQVQHILTSALTDTHALHNLHAEERRLCADSLHMAAAASPDASSTTSRESPVTGQPRRSESTRILAMEVCCFSAAIDPLRWRTHGYHRHPVEIDLSRPSARRQYGEGVITEIMYGGTLVLECSSAAAARHLTEVLANMTWSQDASLPGIVTDVQRRVKSRRAGRDAGQSGENAFRYRICQRIGGHPMRDTVELQAISQLLLVGTVVEEHTISRPKEGAIAPQPSRDATDALTFSRVASAWVELGTMVVVVHSWSSHLRSHPEYAMPVAFYLQRYPGIAPALCVSTLSTLSFHDAALVEQEEFAAAAVLASP